jgi:hypothetical protein
VRFDAAWAWAGMVVVAGLLLVFAIGWVIEFVRKHGVFVWVVILTAVLAFVIWLVGGRG